MNNYLAPPFSQFSFVETLNLDFREEMSVELVSTPKDTCQLIKSDSIVGKMELI